eukprot:4080631-Prymnesium_polylepis.1
MHAGHRLLLAVTALVCGQTAYIGVTGDLLLANKKARSARPRSSHHPPPCLPEPPAVAAAALRQPRVKPPSARPAECGADLAV